MMQALSCSRKTYFSCRASGESLRLRLKVDNIPAVSRVLVVVYLRQEEVQVSTDPPPPLSELMIFFLRILFGNA